MAFRGVVAIVVMVVAVTEACDGSSVCDDMHQKIVSILVSCVEPVWPCFSSFFFEMQGQPVLRVFRIRAVFSSSNSEEHQVTGSKPVSVSEFFVDFPVSGVVRAKPQKVKLWCDVKLVDGMPPRSFQWNFLLED